MIDRRGLGGAGGQRRASAMMMMGMIHRRSGWRCQDLLDGWRVLLGLGFARKSASDQPSEFDPRKPIIPDGLQEPLISVIFLRLGLQYLELADQR